MAVISGIRFLGYIDSPEELLGGGKRRCLFGCDGSSAAENLPTNTGLELDNGSKTAAPAPWSLALVKGEGVLALGTNGSWGAL